MQASAASTGSFRYGAILTSALLCALYVRVELPWAFLWWVMLVPWLATLERERTMAAAVWNGTATAMAFTVAVFPWFALAVARYTGISQFLAGSLLILAAPFLQPQFIVFAAVRHRLAARGRGRPLVSVAAAGGWVGTEWLCPRLFGDTIGHGLHPFPTLRQAADLTGAAGLTFVSLLVNEAVHAALTQWRRSPRRAFLGITAAAALVCALAGYGALRLRQITTAAPSHPPLTAALIQANLDDYDDLRERMGTFAAVRSILDVHTQLSLRALEHGASRDAVELLVWPETVYPTTFGKPKSAAGAQLDAEIVRFAEQTRIPLLFGTYDRDGDVEHNAAVLLQPSADGAPDHDVYRKRRLFPFTEEVPTWLESPFLRDRLPWLGTWRAGDGPPVLTLRRSDGAELKIAPLICLDAVDTSLGLEAARRGADLILTLSNDGWFAGGAGARLHLVVSAFRSIETRLPQLRATNTGISAVITATGDIVARTATGKATVLTGSVHPGREEPTLMARWGDWFGPAACFATLVMLWPWPSASRGSRRAVE
jgi:apolipoprotein N-acyltransferase